ncbi:MAG TPA: TRAM domain-containing protein [Nitrososphaera sp.]|nr:TRAM domain-containing protein [Nitrososphaera sp.]
MSYGGRSNYGGGRGYSGGRGFGGDRGFGGPKPVETGKEYDVQISEISRQGDGIARIQGFVIFVKGGKVGQKSRVKITNVGARFATAEIVSEGQQTPPSSSPSQPAAATSPATEEKPKEVAPQVSEEEKPTLQDYKSGGESS